MDDFSGKLKSVQIEFRYISNEPIEIEVTRNEMNQVLKKTLKEIKKLIFDTKEFLTVNQFDIDSVTLLINGNGFRYPGLKDIFIKEFPHNFRQRHVFHNEEIIIGALQNGQNTLTYEIKQVYRKHLRFRYFYYFYYFRIQNHGTREKKTDVFTRFHESKNGQKNGPFFRVKTRLI